MPTQDYRGRGVVKMNPLGPHFYVDVEEGEKPPGMVDLITDTMNNFLGEINADHAWEVTHSHVQPHTPITEVLWTPNEGASYNIDLHAECPSVSMDWYTHDEVEVGP